MTRSPWDDDPNESPRRTILLVILVALAAFLLGRYAWARVIEEPHLVFVPFPIVVSVEPDCETAAARPRRARPSIAHANEPAAPQLGLLPDAESHDAGLDRLGVLAWVRSQTSLLRSCTVNQNGTVTHASASVRVRVRDNGEFERVTVRDPNRLMTPEMEHCLTNAMLEWSMPPELSGGARDLIFSLSL